MEIYGIQKNEKSFEKMNKMYTHTQNVMKQQQRKLIIIISVEKEKQREGEKKNINEFF